MDRVGFMNWTFEVDREQTILEYQKKHRGDSETCDCSEHQNFVITRHGLYPKEILDFFQKLGIDPLKEDDCRTIERLKNGRFLYGVTFYFVGKVVKPFCDIPSDEDEEDKPECQLRPLIPFNKNLSIGFFDTYSQNPFTGDVTRFVDIRMEISAPWRMAREIFA